MDHVMTLLTFVFQTTERNPVLMEGEVTALLTPYLGCPFLLGVKQCITDYHLCLLLPSYIKWWIQFPPLSLGIRFVIWVWFSLTTLHSTHMQTLNTLFMLLI